jgi:chorismate synthase
MSLHFTTAGESHGPAVIATVFGLPFGHRLDVDLINAQLRRRQGGHGRCGRQNLERDEARVLSGLRHGLTLGSPLTLLIHNRDARLEAAPPVHNARPGHVDLAGALKIGSRDARDVLERASARETAARVMAGAACLSLLHEFGMDVVAHVQAIGGFTADAPLGRGYSGIVADARAARDTRDASPVYTLARQHDPLMMAEIDAAKTEGDTLGGVIEIVATGVPPGLGSHNTWPERLDAQLAGALMGIQAIKAVEIGLGAAAASRRGSAVHDPARPRAEPHPRSPFARDSNHAGGIEGGISNGEPVVCRVAMKPISTLRNPLPSVDLRDGRPASASTERSDVCAVPAAAIVAECVTAFVLARALLAKTGGDSISEARRNFDAYLRTLDAYRSQT